MKVNLEQAKKLAQPDAITLTQFNQTNGTEAPHCSKTATALEKM